MNVFLRAEVVLFLNDMQNPFFDGLDAIAEAQLARVPEREVLTYDEIK